MSSGLFSSSFPNKQKTTDSAAAGMSSSLGSNLSELDRLLLELNAVQHSTPSFAVEGKPGWAQQGVVGRMGLIWIGEIEEICKMGSIMLVMTLLPNLKEADGGFLCMCLLSEIRSMKAHCMVRKYCVFKKRLFTEENVQIYFFIFYVCLFF